MSDPLAYVDEIAELPAGDIERIMGGNMYGLLGIAAA
jgi:hypothetical protein